LKHIAKIEAAPSIAIMAILKTSNQILTMMDYIHKHRETPQDEEVLWRVAVAISEQVK
jgi:hypothetical protein